MIRSIDAFKQLQPNLHDILSRVRGLEIQSITIDKRFVEDGGGNNNNVTPLET